MNRYEQQDYFFHGGDYNPDQWLDYPDVLADDLKLMREGNTNTFSVGIFAWSALEPVEGKYQFEWLDKIIDDIAANGGNVILATPSAARPAWLSEKYPEVLRTNERREKMLHGGRHNHCFSSPVYREKVMAINQKLAERYGQHPALLMWHVSNEYSGECHCELCQESFRTWLKTKYQTLDALNHSWWGPFWSHTITDWSQVESPSPIGESMVHGLTLDWRRFVTDQTIDFFETEAAPLRKAAPGVPITTNFMADTHDLIPFQSLDYGKFAQHVDVLSWDCYPAWHNDWETTADLASKVGFINDLYRSLKQQPFLIMESTPSGVNWHEVNKTKRPGMHLLSSLQFIAHGSDSNLYFQWRKSRGSSEKFHGAVVDHDNDVENRVFQDVKEVGAVLNKIKTVRGSQKKSKVAIIYDWENNWALNDAQGFSQESKRYPQTLQEHYRYFWNQDIPVDVITSEQDFAQYELIVAPMLYLIREQTMLKLEAFVKSGGKLVSTYLTGYVNESDLAYLGGWPETLRAIFGIKVLETDTLYPKDRVLLNYGSENFFAKDYCTRIALKGAEPLAYYQNEFYRDTAAITVNQYGTGQAYFIGARGNHALLEEVYNGIVKNLELFEPIVIQSHPDVSIQTRQGEELYHFVMNFSEEVRAIELKDALIDLISAEEVSGKLSLAPYEVKVLTNLIVTE
ncbi:beta-galactosidase [uncultured Vagococcus sp.]|uniref:beta-galactosidase n=1 Tax=uncultured Vagococcus sp. TaxID=189676 RepID=UPI0028CFE837|nr:beta-galactosidase [uncultured Vagococcus sp.]